MQLGQELKQELEKERIEAAFFEAVRTVIVKISSKDTLNVHQINEQITNLLNQSINSTGVINVINVSDEVSLFDPEFFLFMLSSF